jgi:hypothetical protein
MVMPEGAMIAIGCPQVGGWSDGVQSAVDRVMTRVSEGEWRPNIWETKSGKQSRMGFAPACVYLRRCTLI